MARQAAAPGFPFALDLNETGTRQTSAPGVDINENSGGNTYAVSLTETGAAADTVSSNAILPSSLTESGSAADTTSSTATLPSSLAENGAAADTVSTTATLPSSIGEAGGAVETVSNVAVLPSTIAESGSALDTPTLGNNYAVSVAEAASALDLVNWLAPFTAFAPIRLAARAIGVLVGARSGVRLQR